MEDEVREKIYAVYDECCVATLCDIPRLHSGKCDDQLLKGVAVQLLHALNFLHTEQRIAHLDLKPENVLISASGFLKVADLDCAQVIFVRSRPSRNATPVT